MSDSLRDLGNRALCGGTTWWTAGFNAGEAAEGPAAIVSGWSPEIFFLTARFVSNLLLNGRDRILGYWIWLRGARSASSYRQDMVSLRGVKAPRRID